MIPSLVLIKSPKKRLITLTKKKSLKIGTCEDCDVIVNHPHLRKHPQVLETNSTVRDGSTEAEAKGSYFLPVYTFSLNGFKVQMIHMKILSYALLTMCIGITSIKAYLTYQSTNHIAQDWTPITLPAKGIFGFCRQDRKHGEGARFSFEAKRAQPHRLAFFGGSQGGGATLTISLNGTVINKPMILPEGWGEESSVSLPSDYIRDGSNIVDILPASNTKGHKKWGVSDIRVLPIGPSNSYKDVAAHNPGSILYALEQREMSGQQLAHYYKTVSSWATSSISERFTLDKNKIMEEIEQKMRNKLHQVAFEVRSKNILGDHITAQKLLDDTKSWIPFDWMEGWKIYNGLCH